MNERANDPLMSIVTDFFSTVLKGTEQSLQQGLSVSSQDAVVAEWSQSTPFHIADATFRMEPNGNISLLLTVAPKS